MNGVKKEEVPLKIKSNVESSTLDVDNSDSRAKAPGFGERYKQCVVLFVSVTVLYSMRACMGVALVAMSDSRTDLKEKPPYDDSNTAEIANVSQFDINVTYSSTVNSNHRMDSSSENITSKTVVPTHLKDNGLNGSRVLNLQANHFGETEGFQTHGILNSLLLVPPYPKFWWNKKRQDTIQSSFFWGYMTLQLPGGWLAHRYGARRLLVGALSCNAVISFSLPWAAFYGGWVCMVICRVMQGLTQACLLPSIHTFLGKWAPLEERSRMVGFVCGGQALGTVLGLPLTGFVAASEAGWPGVFRVYGLLSAAVALTAFFTLADTPRQHPKITPEETHYIEEGLQGGIGDDGKRLPVPWSAILTSKAVLAIAVAHTAQNWGQLTLFAELPAYMARVMGVNIRANGLLTALPFLVMWFTNFFFNWLMDFIIIKKLLSVTHTRKLANSIGCVMPALGLIALAFAPKNLYAVEGILVFICAFKIASHVGFMTNNVDLSQNFAGTIASVSNFVSNLVGSQAPLVAGLILTDPTDERQWKWVFFVSAGLYIFSNTVYVVLGSAERASWDGPTVPAPLPAEVQPMMPVAPSSWRNKGTRPSIASLSDDMY